MRALFALGLLAGCQPGGPGEDTPGACAPNRPDEGELLVGVVACDQMDLSGGAGRVGDYWLANRRFRVVVRHPQASLTLLGLGGGTVIDGAPWGVGDGLHEVAPLVGGGWLDVDGAEELEDGLRFEGTILSLPGRATDREGERATVTWRIAPDDPWLRFEGADGLWLHVGGTFERMDGWLWGTSSAYGHDGQVAEDLGGALVIEGANGLFLGTPKDALVERAGVDGVEVSGTAVNAERIRLRRDGVLAGWFAVAPDGSFAATIPADIDELRAESTGRASSAWNPPATELELGLGETASFELRPAWPTERRRPLHITWTAFDGRVGVNHLPASGGTLFLGKGDYELVVSAGPSYAPVSLAVEADVGAVPVEVVGFEERFDPGVWRLGALGVPVDRARDWHGSDTFQANDAVASGADWLVFTAPDDVATVSEASTAFPAVPHLAGSTTVDDAGAWSILSWPWSANENRPGAGAVDPEGLSPEDALAAAVGGVSRDRHTVVDLGWLEAAGPPWTVDPAPEGVRLEAPGTEGPAAWAPWFAWLDAAVPLSPVGSLAWFPVIDPANAANEDFVQGFTGGRTVATTGPLLELSIGTSVPGDLEPDSPASHRLVEVRVGGAHDLDQVALLTDGGVVLRQWELAGLPDEARLSALVSPGRWLVAAAWDDDAEAFAATAPIWTDPP